MVAIIEDEEILDVEAKIQLKKLRDKILDMWIAGEDITTLVEKYKTLRKRVWG